MQLQAAPSAGDFRPWHDICTNAMSVTGCAARISCFGAQAVARVLVVDDDIETLNTLSGFLHSLGHEVRTAPCGVAVLEGCSDWEPEIILLDFVLPGLSGAEVMRALKDFPPAASVIVITGHGDLHLARYFLKLGAREFLRKPIDLEYLELVMSFELKLRRLREKVA